MKDEIKEINIKIPGQILDYVDTKEHLLDLFNYITNLQQQLHQASLDIQELIERDIECPSWCDKLTNLQQIEQDHKETNATLMSELAKLEEENERLKQENYELKSKLECYENGVYYSSKVDELEEENKRLKETIKEITCIPQNEIEVDYE